jgi:hypothetical protein
LPRNRTFRRKGLASLEKPTSHHPELGNKIILTQTLRRLSKKYKMGLEKRCGTARVLKSVNRTKQMKGDAKNARAPEMLGKAVSMDVV